MDEISRESIPDDPGQGVADGLAEGIAEGGHRHRGKGPTEWLRGAAEIGEIDGLPVDGRSLRLRIPGALDPVNEAVDDPVDESVDGRRGRHRLARGPLRGARTGR